MDKSMKLSIRQKGVTLLEVLVGFVIFTTSLVAVLDFVSGQIYQSQLSTSYLKKIQMIYERSSLPGFGVDSRLSQSPEGDVFLLTVSSTSMDSSAESGTEIRLNRHSFSLVDGGNTLAWTVLEVN